MLRVRQLAAIACVFLLVFVAGSFDANGRQDDENATKPATEPSKPAPKAKADSASIGRGSILKLARNPLFWPLFLCSITAVGFALERFFALRKGRVVPKEFVTRFIDRLSGGKLDRERAIELCKAQDSPVARIFGRIVGYWGEPAADIRQAIGHDIGGELSDLKRNVRVLNGTATLAPLLGLLGRSWG